MAECRIALVGYEMGRLAFLHSPASQSQPGLAEHYVEEEWRVRESLERDR
jgi:hypothetical protein